MTQNTQHCVYDAVQNQLIALVRLKSRREKRRAQGGHYPIPGPAENLRIGCIFQPLLSVGILSPGAPLALRLRPSQVRPL